VRRGATGSDIFTSLVGLVGRNKRRYGGYIVHVGAVMFFLGCAGQTYKQSTEIYKRKADGNWTQSDKGRIVGQWSGGKCKFKPPTGQNDFRSKKYSPVYQQQTHYRIVSTVTTGKGIVWGPSNQPSNTSAVAAQALGLAVPRGVCFAVEHPHADNTQVEGCADPTR
ncbi:MAG: hypothetical protein ABI968_14400, partial [Acidobacteriota bacterium]